MAKEGDLSTIFNPRGARTPSVIVTSEDVESQRSGDSDRERPNGPQTPHSPRAPLTPQSSISSAPPFTTQPSLQTAYSESATSSQDEERQHREKSCAQICFSKTAMKIYYGICISTIVAVTLVFATHLIKFMYMTQYDFNGGSVVSTESSVVAYTNLTSKRTHNRYNAPFFTTWFLTNWLIFFYPLYVVATLLQSKCVGTSEILSDSLRDFREKGFTFARFISRCGLFCLLWVVTIYMFVYSLRILLPTDVLSLFATNVSCVYLLSWVILHEQFVGVRIVATIMCDTGIALLAYMDGITGNSTLGGVVLAAFAAAGFGIFKVLSRKVLGELYSGQRALFFSLIGIVNASLLWPVCLALYLSGSEVIPSHHMPWIPLLLSSVTMLAFHLMYQFANIITYNIFISLGLVIAIPISAGLDVSLYGIEFQGMKLWGIVLISVGFLLVMFPDNWPDYIMRLLRWSRSRKRGSSGSGLTRDTMDYRTGYIRSHLRSPSGRVR